jgi:hypothetical protein
MRSIIALGLLSTSLALAATGCGAGGDSETESVGQATQALSKSAYFWDGPALFTPFSLYQNCTLTVETTDGNNLRDPVLALIINSGSLGWGSSTVPCRHGALTATDGFTTLAFSSNISSTNYNAKVSYKNPNGGAGLTVFAVGFLDATNQGTQANFGNLNVKYSITGCSDPSKNKSSTTITQSFWGSGIQGSFPGYAYTWEPRPGGPQCATDTILFGINPTVNGFGQCNDDCPAPLGTPTLSCISNNTGSNLWWMSPGWKWNGVGSGFTSVNNP